MVRCSGRPQKFQMLSALGEWIEKAADTTEVRALTASTTSCAPRVERRVTRPHMVRGNFIRVRPSPGNSGPGPYREGREIDTTRSSARGVAAGGALPEDLYRKRRGKSLARPRSADKKNPLRQQARPGGMSEDSEENAMTSGRLESSVAHHSLAWRCGRRRNRYGSS